MKTNIRNLFNRFLALLLAVLILSSLPSTAYATANSDLEIVENDASVELEDTVLSGEGNYSYTTPDAGMFLIESVAGVILIANELPVIEFDNQTISIPSFDYYKVVDPNGNLRFYQADVLKNPLESNNFVYVALYVEDGSVYSIHIHYWVATENKLYNIMTSLTEEQFLYFVENATELCLGSDAISQRLKTSGRVHRHGTFDSQATSNSNNGDSILYNASVMPTALNTISANSYDSYTDHDGIIHSYASDYFYEYYLEDGYTITDDPIVNVIPKELCFIPGEHIYIGKEYGFFIRVVVDTIDVSSYAVDVLVFDIAHSTPSFTTTETGSSKVTPLFQYTYCASDVDSLMENIDPALSRIVVPHLHYDYADYLLKDIGFKFTLDNPTALNPSDAGYIASEDNGAFMIQTRVNASGVGLKQEGSNFADDTAIFALGFVPLLGDGLSVFSYAHDLYNGFGNQNYFYSISEEVSNNELNINTLKTNSTDQIAAYGNLIKSQSIKLISDATKPRLIHVGGGYVEAKYVIARKSGSTYNQIRVVTSISVSVVEDDTSYFLGIKSGELIDYGRGTGTYETSAYTRLNDISLNGAASTTIPANSKKNVIKIVPKVSGTYKIFTSSSYGNPIFRITNATAGTATVVATDDINGINNRNATLTLNLVSGNVYYLEAYRYGTPYNYTLRIGYNPTATKVLVLNSPYNITTSSNTYQMLKFSPTTSGYYKISTNKTSGDPQLFLFSADGTLLDSDDDSGGNRNSLLEHYLVAGNTYYVAAQGYNGYSAAFSVTVTPI